MRHGVDVRIGNRTAVTSLLIIRLRALDDWIFGEPDSFAWVQEWQIGRGRLLRRSYRDARFAALVECGLCRGEGTAGRAAPAQAGCTAGPVGAEAGCAAARMGREIDGGAGRSCSLCDGAGRIDRLWLREGR